jgi:hypothetical protein
MSGMLQLGQAAGSSQLFLFKQPGMQSAGIA